MQQRRELLQELRKAEMGRFPVLLVALAEFLQRVVIFRREVAPQNRPKTISGLGIIVICLENYCYHFGESLNHGVSVVATA